MKTKQQAQEVAGKISSVQFLRTITAKKDGKSYNKYQVMIDGAEYFALDDKYQNKIGEVGTWKYTDNEWVDKLGVKHSDRTLNRLWDNAPKQPARPSPQRPTTSAQSGAETAILAKLDKIERKLNDLYELLTNDPQEPKSNRTF